MRLFDELGEDSLPGLRPFQAKADQISAYIEDRIRSIRHI